jgi:hypothetical protein
MKKARMVIENKAIIKDEKNSIFLPKFSNFEFVLNLLLDMLHINYMNLSKIDKLNLLLLFVI